MSGESDSVADRLTGILGASSIGAQRMHGRSRVAAAIAAVVRTVLPEVCAGCGASGNWLCPLCDQTARRIDLASVCRRCGQHQDRPASSCSRCDHWVPSLRWCRSAYEFDGAVRNMIHRLKYRGEFARAEWCGREIGRLAIELGWHVDLLVPVPLHPSRYRQRGYNQSERIAAVTGELIGIPKANVLERTRPTATQVGLDAIARRENVRGAFRAAHDLKGLSILLIDDVVTTGATLESCAVACSEAGARDVRALTLATGQ